MSVNRFSRIASTAMMAGAFYLVASGPSPLRAQTANNVICNGCVGGSDIANFSVSAGKLSTNSVSNPKIASGAVTEGKIAKGAVTGPKIENFTVSAGKLSPNSVTNPKIAYGAVTRGKLASNAQPGGGDFHEYTNSAFGLSIIPLVAGDTIVRFVTMTLPAAGVVILNVSGFFDHSGGARSTGRCELTTGTTIDVLYGKTVVYIDGESGDENSIALTRGFNVTGPGSTTFRLICDRYSGPGDLDIVNPSLTAIYVPQQY